MLQQICDYCKKPIEEDKPTLITNEECLQDMCSACWDKLSMLRFRWDEIEPFVSEQGEVKFKILRTAL